MKTGSVTTAAVNLLAVCENREHFLSPRNRLHPNFQNIGVRFLYCLGERPNGIQEVSCTKMTSRSSTFWQPPSSRECCSAPVGRRAMCLGCCPLQSWKWKKQSLRCKIRNGCFIPTAISTGCFTPSAQNGSCGIPAVPHYAFYRVQRTVRCARRRDSQRAADGKKEYQIHRLRFFALERRDRT